MKILYKKSSGFTLVEFLIVVAILGVIGTLVLSVLFTTFRVTRKADGLVELRQTGDAVASQVIRNIRYATELEFPNSCVGNINTSYITIVESESSQRVTYSCDSSINGGIITSNGDALIDENRFNISDCSFSCIQSTVNEPPTIGITFKLHLLHNTNLSENQASVPFSTSVTLRNYNN
jgi:prepilin-type N-terminal cleavage/methylation domain-containing protein